MSLINPKTNLTNFLCPMSAEWNIALVPPVNYGLPALHDLEIEWKINVRYSSDVACRKIRDKKVTNFRRKRPIVWCFRSLNDGKCPEKRESDYVWKTMTWGDLKAVTHDWKYIATMSDSISLFSCAPAHSQCWKNTQNVAFEFFKLGIFHQFLSYLKWPVW